ncbi:elongation factor Ts [Acholeplasma equirhinis]|uniref:translation elongation factor Ts n=1 Tax=Acholeplasma equirhinis TaxID=555393 RepID=UPI00197AFE28|nr:translation elongation factor Ts [Acholeplasma equirhinis]MBN3491204.1 elongation factor Ts [Acholeplasma equirhinis]
MVVTAAMVKELRDRTGAGMLDCKKALEETQGDVEKAIDYLREKGIAKAAKKADRIAAEGLTNVLINGNEAILFELNSETDFVAKNEKFLALLEEIGQIILNSNAKSTEEALALIKDGATVEQMLLTATATIGEKISLRRVVRVTKESNQGFGSYKHMGGKISVLTITAKEDAAVAKDVAMHVCVFNPRFLSRADVDQQTVEHETHIIKELMAQDASLAGKPEKVLEGILQGKLSKTLQEFVLLDQAFVKDPSIKVSQYLKNNSNDIISYVRLEVGEGIEKQETDFAAEVMAQVK